MHNIQKDDTTVLKQKVFDDLHLNNQFTQFNFDNIENNKNSVTLGVFNSIQNNMNRLKIHSENIQMRKDMQSENYVSPENKMMKDIENELNWMKLVAVDGSKILGFTSNDSHFDEIYTNDLDKLIVFIIRQKISKKLIIASFNINYQKKKINSQKLFKTSIKKVNKIKIKLCI